MSSKGFNSIHWVVVAATLCAASAWAEGDDVAAAITAGKASLDLRYRYEFVDQDTFSRNANASTLRVRLNYQTAAWQSWSGFIEFDQVIEVIADNFNSGAGTSGPGRNVYPVVADPDGADLNQLYFQYAPGDAWTARIGRQRILLDDHRFVGNVGWRQNEQTYDSLSFKYRGFRNTEVFYSYVTNVNRIYGDGVPAGDDDQDTHLLNVNVGIAEGWKLIGYAYLIDSDDTPAFSTNTFGARVSGAVTRGDNRFELLGELATQSDSANNPASFDTSYYRLQGTWTHKLFSAGVGLESLGSDNGQGFRTPLATLHAFNGWADQFLTTPGTGLEDLYVNFGYKPAKWNLQFVYHDFSAESGSGDFGSELDLSAGRKLTDRYSLLFKAALFNADSAAYVDTNKFWVMLTAGF